MRSFPLACAAVLQLVAFTEQGSAQKAPPANYEAMVAMHAAANGVPVSLVHRVIMRESRYNPRAVSRGNYGMMQIKLATARSLGYTGTAQGLLDANTNLTYAVKYLAGAYRVAGGNHDRAVSYYARGYYYAAKRQGTTRVASAKDQARVADNSSDITGSIQRTRPSQPRRVATSDNFLSRLLSSAGGSTQQASSKRVSHRHAEPGNRYAYGNAN